MRHFRSKVSGTAAFVFLIATALFAATEVSARTVSFDLRLPTPARRVMSVSPTVAQDGIVRSVRLDAGVAMPGELFVGDELIFSLFNDVTVNLTLKKKMQAPLGGEVFLAEVSGYEGMKTAVVLSTPEGLTIDVQDFLKNKVYKVISTQTGVKVLEIEPFPRTESHCAALEPSVRETASVSRKSLVAAEPRDPCIDILVAYDKRAAEFAELNGGITNFAQIAVQKMNTALANTLLDEKFW